MHVVALKKIKHEKKKAEGERVKKNWQKKTTKKPTKPVKKKTITFHTSIVFYYSVTIICKWKCLLKCVCMFVCVCDTVSICRYRFPFFPVCSTISFLTTTFFLFSFFLFSLLLFYFVLGKIQIKLFFTKKNPFFFVHFTRQTMDVKQKQ